MKFASRATFHYMFTICCHSHVPLHVYNLLSHPFPLHVYNWLPQPFSITCLQLAATAIFHYMFFHLIQPGGNPPHSTQSGRPSTQQCTIHWKPSIDSVVDEPWHELPRFHLGYHPTNLPIQTSNPPYNKWAKYHRCVNIENVLVGNYSTPCKWTCRVRWM
jgi:hypothetical protein